MYNQASKSIILISSFFILFSFTSFSQDEVRFEDYSKLIQEKFILQLLNQTDSGNLENVKLLLDVGVNPSSSTWDGVTPLMYAAQNGHYKVARELIAYGADLNSVNSSKFTALHYATISNHDSIAELLILNGANVHPVNSDGISPLHYSSAYGYPFMTHILLSYGAQVDSVDWYGNTPLLTAVYSGSLMTTEILLEQWANVNISDIKGYTPLMVAAQFNDTTLVRLLTDYGANVNQPNSSGITALAIAIANRAEESAIMLLEKGASIKDEKGILSYADLAKKYRLVELSSVLENLGSPVSRKPKISELSFYTGTIFNSNDFYFTFGSSTYIAIYGLTSSIEFGVRPYKKAVLVDKDYDLYQFFERRRQVSFAVEKSIQENYKRLGVKTTIALGIKGIYSWGNYTYYGAQNIPKTYSRLSPVISYYYQKNGLLLGAQGYLLGMRHNPRNPFMINLTLGYSIDLSKPKIKNKIGEWF